jgi:hypothetical protein
MLSVGIHLLPVALAEAPGRFHFGGRAGGDQVAPFHDQNAVGNAGHGVQVVGGEEERFARLLKRAQQGQKFGPCAYVQAGGRFVEQQNGRIRQQGQRQGQPLL